MVVTSVGGDSSDGAGVGDDVRLGVCGVFWFGPMVCVVLVVLVLVALALGFIATVIFLRFLWCLWCLLLCLVLCSLRAPAPGLCRSSH